VRASKIIDRPGRGEAGVTAGDARISWARLYVVAGAALGCLGILLLARTFNFYFDEWDFILTAPDWNWVSYLQPHNEHPAMIPHVVYAVLLNTAGLRTYLPYMAFALLLHGLNVVLVFELIRRRNGDVVGLGAAALLILLGAGWENLLWAFQLMFLWSVACGLLALLVLERPRTNASMPLVSALVLLSIMSSGIGLFFLVGAVVHLAAVRARRRDLVWLAPIALAVLVWYLALGRTGAAVNPPAGPLNILRMPAYAAWGIGAAAAGLVGLGGWWGPPALLLGAAVLAWTWWHRPPDAFALSVLAALVSFYVVTGLSRAQFGYEQSASGRYVYEGAVFWLLLLGDAARALPWRGTWRPALIACVFLATFNSGALLFEFAAGKTVQMQREAADLQALNAARGDPCLGQGAAVDPFVMPSVNRPALYYRAVDRYGNPAPPGPVTDPADYGVARSNLDRPGCR
jgi:hypothetical protein